MSSKKLLVLSLTLISGLTAFSQTQSTDIWMADISMRNNKAYVSLPVRITQNEYYDNQPCFSPDGTMLYYASMPDTIQSDIYEYNIKKKSWRQLTSTMESEYQPQPIPYDKKKISVVRVDLDKAQRFYALDLMDGAASSDPLMTNEDSLAYYAWMNDTTVGSYMLNGEGGALHQFDMKVQQSIILMPKGGFGRCLARVPGSDDLSYVQKGSEGVNTLVKYMMATEERESVVDLPEGVEDYAWGPDGKIWVGSKGKLLYYDTQATEKKWVEAADWAKITGNFYRVAMSKDGSKIALVTYSGTKP